MGLFPESNGNAEYTGLFPRYSRALLKIHGAFCRMYRALFETRAHVRVCVNFIYTSHRLHGQQRAGALDVQHLCGIGIHCVCVRERELLCVRRIHCV
jgi:hypothetical protein